MTSFEEYYDSNFEKWTNYLSKLIHDPEEAEDRIQDIFTSLLTRKEFFDEMIQRDKTEFDRYILRAVILQTGQISREQETQIPTVGIDSDNIDFLSSIRDTQSNNPVMDEVELNNFYEIAVECLAGGRKPASDCGFDTIGELRQYIFVQRCRNGRTFEEIAELVGLHRQGVFMHFVGIVAIVAPLIERFIGKKLDSLEINLT